LSKIIIANNQHYNKPLYFDRLSSIKKRNGSTRFEYYHLANKYKHLQKNLITFTYHDVDQYTKLSMINDIRNYFNRLIKNTKNDSIKFFSSIELGENIDNPHLHIQIWHENQKQIDKIYEKVIDRFGLFSEFCKITLPDTNKELYAYVIKDYSKSLSDDELLRLDDARRVYRSVLDKNVRFSSHSKGKYTKKVYKSLYSRFNIKKDDVDCLIDDCVIDLDRNVTDYNLIEFVFLLLLHTKENKSQSIECYRCESNLYYHPISFEWWTFGKLWKYSDHLNNKNYKGSKYENVNILFTG